MEIHTLRLSDEQVRILVAALQEMPYRVSAPLLNEIHNQVVSGMQSDNPGEQKAGSDSVSGEKQGTDKGGKPKEFRPIRPRGSAG